MALSSAPSTMIPSTNNSIHHSGFNFTRRLISSVTTSTVFIESKITRNHLGPSSVEDNVLNIVNFEENSNESRTRTFFGNTAMMIAFSNRLPIISAPLLLRISSQIYYKIPFIKKNGECTLTALGLWHNGVTDRSYPYFKSFVITMKKIYKLHNLQIE